MPVDQRPFRFQWFGFPAADAVRRKDGEPSQHNLTGTTSDVPLQFLSILRNVISAIESLDRRDSGLLLLGFETTRSSAVFIPRPAVNVPNECDDRCRCCTRKNSPS